jgi:NADPH:quinone reductase-like Zn-dependent oxidoreductase
MQAAVLRAFGGPEGIAIESWPDPEPGPDEVLVRVRAVSVNRTDVYAMTRTNIGRRIELPHIGGVDPAGEIVARGDSTRERSIGERVVTRPMIPCRACRFCLVGPESLCEGPAYVGIHRPGGFAELVALPERAVYPIPDGLSYEEASAAAHSVPIAIHLLQTVGTVGPGDVVLVVGAAGGLGLSCVQVARIAGARVIAVVGNERKADAAIAVGADAAITYDPLDRLADRVRDSSDGRGATVLVDNVGDARLWEPLVAALDRGGRILSCGSHAGGRVVLDLNLFYRQQLRLLSTAGTTDEEFRAALRLVADGRVRPIIERVFPLSGIGDAFRMLLGRGNAGKIVIRVA